jgi:hypothetical protein
MQDFIEFQRHIKEGINSYLRLHRGKNISQDRLNDIAKIQKIIGVNSFDYRQPRKNLSNYLKEMRTGWGIFKTGRSKLKKSIRNELRKFKNKNSHVLLTPNGKIPLTTSISSFFSQPPNTTIQSKNDMNLHSGKNKEQAPQPTIKPYVFTFLK